MAILTATEVTLYSNISCSAGTITSKNLIPVVQARVTTILNNYFCTDLDLVDTFTFNPSATNATIVARGNSFDDRNFVAGDDVYIYGSYRNDGYQTVASVATSTLTLVSGSTIYDELSSASIVISVVKWPLDVKVAAAKMCAYDYDTRDSVSANINSRSLGPLSETYTDSDKDEFGYPKSLTSALEKYRVVRIF